MNSNTFKRSLRYGRRWEDRHSRCREIDNVKSLALGLRRARDAEEISNEDYEILMKLLLASHLGERLNARTERFTAKIEEGLLDRFAKSMISHYG